MGTFGNDLIDFDVCCREEELSSCQDQLGEFRSAVCALTKWLEETNGRVPAAQPSSSEKNLKKDLQTVNVSYETYKQHKADNVIRTVRLNALTGVQEQKLQMM